MNALARRIFNVFGEDTGVTDQDVQAGVAEREELLDAVTSAGYDGTLARGLGTSQLRELARILGEIRNGEIAVPTDSDEPEGDAGGQPLEAAERRHRSYGDDDLRTALDVGPQTSNRYPPVEDGRAASRAGWQKWNKVSEADLETLLREFGVSDAQLDSMSKEDKGELGEKIIGMSDKEMKEFMRKGYQRGTPPLPAKFAERQAANASARQSRLDKFWQQNRRQLEKFGETREQWQATVSRLSESDADKLLGMK